MLVLLLYSLTCANVVGEEHQQRQKTAEWDVKVQMTFKVATSEDVERIKNAKSEQAGENLEVADLPDGGRAKANYSGSSYRTGGLFRGSGNIAHVTANDGGHTAIHENGHLIGLGDRYTDVTYDMTQNGNDMGRTNAFSQPHEGYEDNLMGSSGGWKLSQEQINNLGSNALNLGKSKGDHFIMGRMVDSHVDKVPQSYKQDNTTYSDPQFKKLNNKT